MGCMCKTSAHDPNCWVNHPAATADYHFVGELVCGAITQIDRGDDHWIIVCQQRPDHEGPHVGMVSWLADIGADGVSWPATS